MCVRLVFNYYKKRMYNGTIAEEHQVILFRRKQEANMNRCLYKDVA